ncbi:MAG: DNA adenine methylase, partial [Myxococcales bacterium]
DRAYYEQVRAHPVDDGSDAEVAAWMIYLNRTGFNGLYRVNRRNAVNVPFGRYVNPNICDEPRLRACARQLKRAFIHEEGFEAVLERAEKNDLVYFDPPYVPLTKTSNFTSYTSRGFGRAEHERLAEVARTLKRRKVKVVLSNSSAPLVRELYRDFTLHEVQASRMVNSKASARGAVTELLIVG